MNSSVAPLSAVIFSKDASAINITERVLASCGFGVTKVGASEPMRNLIRHNRFDLAVLDHDCGGLDMLGDFAAGAARIVVAFIKAAKIKELSGKRVHFTVQKPLLGDILVRTIRAAYSSIGRDRRINYRFPVSVEVSSCTFAYAGETREAKRVQIVNVSHSGLCIVASEMLPQGATVRLQFPSMEGRVAQASGSVIWVHASGRAGVRLAHEAFPEHQEYGRWLDSMLDAEGDVVPPLRQNESKKIPRLGHLPLTGDAAVSGVARLV